MADGKKSFVLYCDIIKTVEKLPKEKAGELFLIILEYVNDKNPEPDDILIQIAFEPIKQQLKRDLEKWESERVERSESGRLGGIKSGESRRSKQTKQVLQKRSKTKQNEANEAVNVNVNVNVNDINNNIISEHEINNTIEFCSITLHRKYTGPEISELWKAFCILHETHTSKKDKLKHFRNWIKTQPYERDRKSKSGTSAERMEALKNWGKIS